MRLIDADALLERYDLNKATKYGNEDKKQQDFSYSTMMMYEIADMIDDAPTVDAVEQKHGHWYKPQGMMPPEHHGHYECSVCHQWAMHNWKHRLELTDYCPHCGANMRGDNDV